MKTFSPTRILGAGLALCSILIACNMPKAGDSPDGKAAPKIEIIGGDSVNWGRIEPQILKKEIKVTNVGNDTLHISGVQPSCGCTTAPLDKKVLAPGDTATIQISVDVASSSGDIHKSLTINSDDSTRPSIRMALMATLVRDLVADPAFFPPIQSAKVGQEDSTFVQLSNKGDVPVTLEPPMIEMAGEMTVRFAMTKPVTLAPGDSTKLVAYVKALKDGVLQADVIVNNNSKSSPHLKLKLSTSANTGI